MIVYSAWQIAWLTQIFIRLFCGQFDPTPGNNAQHQTYPTLEKIILPAELAHIKPNLPNFSFIVNLKFVAPNF